MNLPHITTKQEEIVKLIYKHRFLKRKHIQQYLCHIDKRRSTKWLKDLKEKQFIDWIYDPNNPDKRSTPAIYFLHINGIRYLRELGHIPENQLRKRYKDGLRQQDFINRCLLLADCCVHLEARNKADNNLHYDYALIADYVNPISSFAYLSESDLIHPDIAFAKQFDSDGEARVQTYLLQLLDLSTPRYMVKKKLKSFVNYLQESDWQALHREEKLPIVLITCPTVAELIHAKRNTKKQLKEVYGDEIPENVKIRFTTTDKLKSYGLTAVIWEDL